MSDWIGTGTLISTAGGAIGLIGPSGDTLATVTRAHRTLLSLERYAMIMGLDPLRMAGGFSNIKPSTDCDAVWHEFDWQSGVDQIGRRQLLDAIANAEYDLAHYLNWWPGPVWISNERHVYPRNHRPEDYSWGRAVRLHTRWDMVRLMGTGTYMEIDPGVITANDPVDGDGDGYAELAVFTINPIPTGMTTAEVCAFFKDFDPLDAANCRTDPSTVGPHTDWEVQPLYCRETVAGVEIKVYIPRWWLFKPQLRLGMGSADIDADDATSYVDTLLFARQYATTPTATLAWYDEDCAIATDDLCATIDAGRPGWVSIPYDQLRDVTTSCNLGRPDEIRLWYGAGAAELDSFWAENIAILATARLTRPLCACSTIIERVRYWQTDLAATGEVSYQTAPSTLTNPLGTRRGEDYVWKRIQRYRLPSRPATGP